MPWCHDRRSPPVEFLEHRNAATGEEAAVPEWRDELEPVVTRQSPEGWQVAMVVVIVAEQHDVDCGQVFEANARRPDTLRSEP